MANSCSLISSHYKNLLDEIDKWSETGKAKSYFKDPYEAAFKLIETEFNMDIETLRHNPDITAGQVSSYKGRLREIIGSIERGTLDSKFAQVFWQSSKFGKKDPVVGNVLNKMGRSGFYFRANEVRDKTLFKAVTTNLREEAKGRSLTTFGGVAENRVEAELNKLDNQWIQSIADWKNNVPNAQEKMFEIKKKIDKLVADSHLKVYDDLLNVLESEEKGSLRDVLKQKYNGLSAKAKKEIDEGKVLKLKEGDLAKVKIGGEKISTPMYRALESYIKLTDGLYSTLRSGVDKRIDSIIKKLLASGRELSAKELTNIKEKLQGKLMPSYEQGFFPHYSRDLNVNMMDGLMPIFEDMQASINDYGHSGNKKSIKKIIREMNTYVDGHAKSRAKDLESGEYDYDYSRNFVNSINNYISDVNRFNFASFMDAHMIDGLMSIERIYKTEGAAKGYAESITNYLQDLHKAANGHNNISEGTRNFMRTLLGFEFVSKLGFNPRGALRNTTQRFLDLVNWGPVQIRRINEYLKTLSFAGGDQELYIENQLKKAGLLFDEVSPEFMQSGLEAPASMFRTMSWNDSSGKFEINKKGKMKWAADKMSWLAGKSSYLHRKAENYNRKHTFKTGYGQMHKWLNSPRYRETLTEQRSATQTGKERIAKGKEVLTEAEFQSIVQRKAGNYAINMVVMNHFDYADYAKSKWTRTKIGRFAGQFQHYSFEFLERNIAILREAKHDVLAGKLLPTNDAQGLQKAYRMGLVYFLGPVIASELLGVDFSNIIEHDSAQRLKQLATLFTGDDEEIKEAFYGKGPIISTVGGPLTSDLLDIGVMLDLVDLDEPSILTLITGLENYDPSTSTEVGAKLRILNTFLGRAYERHIPQLKKGRVGWAIQQEFGLYPTAKARKKKKSNARAVPMELERALRLMEA